MRPAPAPWSNAPVTRVSTIGGGNMAEALLKGLLEAGASPGDLRASDPRAERREVLTTRYGIATTADNAEAARDADIVVLAVKPPVAAAAARSIAAALGDALLVSVAAGVTARTLEESLAPTARVVR